MDEAAERSRRYAEFYDDHYEKLRDYVARRFGANDADDVAQETMLRALAHLDQLTDGRPAMPWLRRVAHHIAVDAQRRIRPELVEAGVLAELSPAVPDEAAQVAIRVDVGGLLQRAMRRLTAQERQALTLRELCGFDIGDIARMTGATSNTVRQRLFRARQNLSRHYRDLGGGSYQALPPVALQPVTPPGDTPGPRPVLRLTAAIHRHSGQPAGRLLPRSAAGIAAVALAGASLLPGTPDRERTARPPAAPAPTTPPLPDAPLPGTAGLPGGPVPLPVPLPLPGAAGPPGLPFTEDWGDGLAGWDVSGRSATPACRTVTGPTCVTLDPGDAVTLRRRLAVPVTSSTYLATDVRVGPDSGATTLTITLELAGDRVEVAIEPDGDARRLSVRSGTTANAPVRLPADGWFALWVRVDPGTRLVTVSRPGYKAPEVTTRLRLRAPPGAVAAVSFHAARPAGAGAGSVDVGRLGLARSPSCYDGDDDDGDGRTDLDDDGCGSMWDDDESAREQCDDGIDNDGDGRTDYPDDPGCLWQRDGSESPGCSDGIDDDGDGLVDYPADPKCASAAEWSELPGCADGVDEDLDDTVDHPADPGCESAADDTEWSCVSAQADDATLVEVVRRPVAYGLCVDPVARLTGLVLVRDAPAAQAVGDVDVYRFTPPGAPARDVPCVSLRGDVAAAPCAALGGTFVARLGRLVHLSAEPAATAGTAARVDVCTAAFMLLAHNTYVSPLNRRQVAVTLC